MTAPKTQSQQADLELDPAHDAWFRDGVEQALTSKEAIVSNDDVRAIFAKKRAAWKAGIAAE
jgi:hypothetical protein